MHLHSHSTFAGHTDLLCAAEAAAYLGVTVGTLEVWRSTRRYPLSYIKVGRAVRYRREDLITFVESRTKNGSASGKGV